MPQQTRSESEGQSTSLWMATEETSEHGPLTTDLKVDVCVVGAGIAGLSVAYLLARLGRSVAVLDDGPVGGGDTQRTTAHLSNAIDDRYFEIERLHGADGARLAAESHSAAIDRIEAIVDYEEIDCDFARLDGFLFLPPGESPEILDRELEAAKRAGLTEVQRLPRAPLGSFDTGPCLCFPRQAQFHPLRYLNGLVRAIQREGGHLFTGTHAERIQGGEPARVECDSGRVVTAGAVVVATNTPVQDRLVIHTKQASYRSYVIGALVPHGSVPGALYWDTLDPYHYVRLQSLLPRSTPGARDVLIVGGEDHKTGQADDQEKRWTRLEDWARQRFPGIESVPFQWSGQVMETIDGLAFIGRNPMDERNVFVATGDSGMGMTHGTIAGILLTDLVLGRENPWAKLYDPSRKTLGAAGRFLQENLNMARQYSGWFKRSEVDSPSEVHPGSGAVVRRALTKIAIYRDDDGLLHARSAVCPHLGGIVEWNDAEKTWDCPCHGSRFDRFGKVINGPANRDLAAAEEPQTAFGVQQ